MKLQAKHALAFLLFLFLWATPKHGNAVGTTPHPKTDGVSSSTEQVELNKAQLEAKLGRKLTLKERLLLPIAKHQLKKGKEATGTGRKSQVVALLLCIFLGYLGIHRFYLGYTGMGVLYLFTAGLFGIGWIIDTILLIIPNGLSPKNNTSYK